MKIPCQNKHTDILLVTFKGKRSKENMMTRKMYKDQNICNSIIFEEFLSLKVYLLNF